MKKQIFTIADAMLPRWVAKLPYTFAILALKLIGFGLDCVVWSRNSVRSKTFIFGVSDLDITVISRRNLNVSFFNDCLLTLKKLFIFLGEINLYDEKDLELVLNHMNPYELGRDPELESFVKLKNKEIRNVDKFVYIQRMLFSDIHSLHEAPNLRQAKWRLILNAIGHNHNQKFIDLNYVIKVLKDLSCSSERISQSIDNWKTKILKKKIDIFHEDFGEGFRILAPHCYLWFHSMDESFFLKGLNEFEKNVVKAQIDWEISGIYSQKYHLERESISLHISRLKMVYSFISNNEELKKLEFIIHRLFYL